MSCGSCDGTGTVCSDCGVGPYLCLCGGPQTTLCTTCKGLTETVRLDARAVALPEAPDPLPAAEQPPLAVTSTLIQMVAAGGGFFIRHEREGYYVGRIDPSGDRLPTDLATLSVASPMAGCKLFPLPLAAVVADKMRVLKTVYDWIASEFGIRGQWQRNDRGDYVLTDINRRFPIVPQHQRTQPPAKVRVHGPRCKRPRPSK